MASYCEMKYRKKLSEGTVSLEPWPSSPPDLRPSGRSDGDEGLGSRLRVQFEELDHMIKRHFDMRLAFYRPNKCTESQYVFSSDVQPLVDQLLRDV